MYISIHPYPSSTNFSLLLSQSPMARLLSQTLIRTSSSSYQTLSHGKSQTLDLCFSPHILTQRYRSNQSGKAQLIQVDLESDGETEGFSMRKLEDVIHNIAVKRSAPDWLPFVPGGSYWVPPPRRPYGLVEVLGKLHSPFIGNDPMSSSSHSSVRCWPSSAFYVEGTSSTHPVPLDMEVEVEVEVNVHTNLENASLAEDEES